MQTPPTPACVNEKINRVDLNPFLLQFSIKKPQQRKVRQSSGKQHLYIDSDIFNLAIIP